MSIEVSRLNQLIINGNNSTTHKRKYHISIIMAGQLANMMYNMITWSHMESDK